MKQQCKNKFVIREIKPVDIYFCVREKGHKGLHKGFFDIEVKKFPHKSKIFYWK